VLKFRAALVGVLIILALTAEVALPVKESLMDSLLRGLDNERNAFSFHIHYVTGFGTCCQDLFIKFLADVVLNQSLLHLCNCVTITFATESNRAVTPTEIGSELSQPLSMIRISRVEFNDGTAYYT
jgi:hypothetical protein